MCIKTAGAGKTGAKELLIWTLHWTGERASAVETVCSRSGVRFKGSTLRGSGFNVSVQSFVGLVPLV